MGLGLSSHKLFHRYEGIPPRIASSVILAFAWGGETDERARVSIAVRDVDRARKPVGRLRRQSHCWEIWKRLLERLIQQALLRALLNDPPHVIRVEFQHFADIIEAEEPIIIPVQDPLGGLREDSFSPSTFGRMVLQVTIDCVLEHRRDQFYLRRMSGTAAIDMEIFMDDDDVGLSE